MRLFCNFTTIEIPYPFIESNIKIFATTTEYSIYIPTLSQLGGRLFASASGSLCLSLVTLPIPPGSQDTCIMGRHVTQAVQGEACVWRRNVSVMRGGQVRDSHCSYSEILYSTRRVGQSHSSLPTVKGRKPYDTSEMILLYLKVVRIICLFLK